MKGAEFCQYQGWSDDRHAADDLKRLKETRLKLKEFKG
jgi:hypothetical protein